MNAERTLLATIGALILIAGLVRGTVTLTENNGTFDGNVSALYFCNSTDCRTLTAIMSPTGNTSAEIQAIIAANPTGNTTAEISTAINNTDIVIDWFVLAKGMSLGWTNLTNIPAVGNTTAQIQTAINNSHIILDWLVLSQGVSLAWGNLTNVPAVGNTTAEMLAVIQSSPTGNTSAEVQAVIDAGGVNTSAEINTTSTLGFGDNGADYNVSQYWNGTCFRIDARNSTDVTYIALCPDY